MARFSAWKGPVAGLIGLAAILVSPETARADVGQNIDCAAGWIVRGPTVPPMTDQSSGNALFVCTSSMEVTCDAKLWYLLLVS